MLYDLDVAGAELVGVAVGREAVEEEWFVLGFW